MARARFGVWFAALALIGCDAAAHIRLLEPDERVEPPTDAGAPPSAPQPPAAGRPAQDAASPTEPVPREPPPVSADAGPSLDAMAADAAPEPTPPPVDSLVLRYDFSGSGDVVPDLVGENDARLIGGATLSPDRPYVNLDGVDDYVDIPNGVISGLHSATIVVWLTWNGGVCWQRVFDFGISDQGEDRVGHSVTSLFMTPKACGGGDPFTAMAEIGRTQYRVADDQALPARYALQVALVVDGDNQTLTLYRDTERVGEAAAPFQLEQLTDANNWLGRSQWEQDGFFSGLIGEFRIYSRVLSAQEIAQIRAEGFEPP